MRPLPSGWAIRDLVAKYTLRRNPGCASGLRFALRPETISPSMYVFYRPLRYAVEWGHGAWVRKQDPGLFYFFHVTCGPPWGKCLQPPRASVSFSLWTSGHQPVAGEHKTRGAEHSLSNPQVPSLKSAPDVWGTLPQVIQATNLPPCAQL